jgi:thiol-disulfide isomerase/thioredoxin
MKKLLLFVLITIITSSLSAQEKAFDKGISFSHGAWSEALAQAKKENKLIFMDAYTTWCGPCKYLAKNVFTNDTVGEFFNRSFVCVKMDMEKGEGIELAKTYGVQAYPTLLYIDGNGQVVHRTCGADYSPSAAKILLGAAKDALDPEKQLISYKKKYDSGNADAVAAYTYLKMLQNGCTDYSAEVNKYMNNVQEKDIASRSNWNIIYNFVADADSRPFRLMMNNKEEFYKLYGKDSVNNKILEAYHMTLQKAVIKNDTKLYDDLKTELEAAKIEGSKKVTLEADMRMYDKKGDMKSYAGTAMLYVNAYAQDDASTLNSIAWRFYESVDDLKMLENAAKWSKRSTELDNIYAYNDTYAAVLYKLGKKDEAKQAAEKAIELAKKSGEDYKETEALLKKIKAMK